MSDKLMKTEAEIREVIDITGGTIKEMAAMFACSRFTIYKMLKEYDLRPYLEAARVDLTDLALETIKGDITNVDTAIRYLNYAKSLGVVNMQINSDKGVIINVNSSEDKTAIDKFLRDE